MLNRFGIGRTLITEVPCSWTPVGEFGKYFRDHGVARTAFDIGKWDRSKAQVLAEVGETAVAFELLGRLFFLPFHSMRHDRNSAGELAEAVSSAIIAYRQKHVAGRPARG
jgi:hypothetical protein